MILPAADEPGTFYVLERRPTVTGERLVDAKLGFDQNGLPSVDFRFDAAGGARFGEYTANNVGKRFAIVLDGEVISAPRIITAILGGAGQITGSFTIESATTLAILLRSGALPAEINVLEERTVGPVLGADSIAAGKAAAVVAGVAVLVFMVLSYGWFGVLADIALAFNVAMIFGLLSAVGATLTLPGVAGIVLTIGMAVDANVLIFERIREELKRVKKPAQAIETGYDRAFSAIVDANVTTIIVAMILFALGAGPVRGFSVTLGAGIVTSVFTAVLVTRFLVVVWMQARRPKQIVI
jgi:preprotein translocase subunit SecD